MPRLPAFLVRLGAAVTALVAVVPASAHAQRCDSVSSRTSLAAFSGQPVASVKVVTHGTEAPAGIAILNALHIRTRAQTIRQHLLFAAGAPLDTLAVAESLRRLRHERYLADAEVSGRRCTGDGGVALTVTTRDSWSTKPEVRMRSTSTTFGMQERNLLGTGRDARVYVRSGEGRLGVGAALRDPYFLGTGAAVTLATNSYADGHDYSATIGRREQSVFDRWRAEAGISRAVRKSPAVAGDTLHRTSALALVGRRVSATPRRAITLLAGVEGEHTTVTTGPGARVVGPGAVRRRFVGVDVGVRRSAGAYDTLTWLLPKSPIIDLPLSTELEMIVAQGYDFATRGPMTHVDLWTGRMWHPRERLLVVGDAWSSGYARENGWDAATLRGSVVFYAPAAHGLWSARLAGERLYAPDPDVRTLAIDDPTADALPEEARFAQSELTASLERSRHLRGLTHSWALDGALFVAASYRSDPVALNPEGLMVGAVGLGLRIVPTKIGRATFRLDVGYPLLRSRELRQRPFVGISLTPWLEGGRQRDGRSSY